MKENLKKRVAKARSVLVEGANEIYHAMMKGGATDSERKELDVVYDQAIALANALSKIVNPEA